MTDEIRDLMERHEKALELCWALSSADVDELDRELDALTNAFSARERETVGRYLEAFVASYAGATTD